MRLRLVVLLGCACAALLAACAQIGVAPTATPTPAREAILITAPVPGVTITSPMLIKGTVSVLPSSGLLTYQVYDSRNVLVGTGPVPVKTNAGQAGLFETQIVYAGAQRGPGKILLLDIDQASSLVRASAELPIVLSTQGGVVSVPTLPGVVTALPGLATPIPVYPAPATSLPGIATPLPGIATPLPVVPSPTALVIAPAPTPQATGGAQQIIFESPAPGTLVGSPVLITGRTTRYPFQGNLSYTIRDATSQIVGQGLIGVDGAEGAPGTFHVELDFNQPSQWGALSIELADEDAVSGQVAARATLVVSFGALVQVQPTMFPTAVPVVPAITSAPPSGQAQAIVIDSPPANTVVGSPLVLRGHVVAPPASGLIYYRVTDAAAVVLGEGTFRAGDDPAQPLAFNTTIPFTLPARDGPIVVELTDRAADGAVVARSALIVSVDVPDSYPQP